MKKTFYAMMTCNGKKSLSKREGDYDEKNKVFYYKGDNGWSATDEFSGMSIVTQQTTKKACQSMLESLVDKLTESRNGEAYLKQVVNFEESLADELTMKG